MKKIALKITIMITVLFLLCGISYSYWTDEVDVYVNAATGETDLRITGSSIAKGSSQNIQLSSYKNVESIKILNLNDESIKIAVTFKNTGTIPVHVDSIRIDNFEFIKGKKTSGKDIDLKATMYVKGNGLLYRETDLKKIKNKNSYINISPYRTVRLEPNEIAVLHVELSYDAPKSNNSNNTKGKDKDKDKNNDKDKNKDESISCDFDLGIVYSRFNK